MPNVSSDALITFLMAQPTPNLEEIRGLLEAGASVKGRSELGETALHLAVRRGEPELVRLLLAHGAEANALDGLGKTPLALARQGRHAEVSELLASAGGKERVVYRASEDPFAPFPFDLEAFRQAARREALSARLLEQELCSAQELVVALARQVHAPGERLALLAALREAASVPPRRRVFEGAQTLRRPFFVHGDLEVWGDLRIVAPFGVTGDLVVRGALCDTGPDSHVMVLGEVSAHALHTDGEFAVGGDLTARDLVIGYYNDNTLYASTIRAPVVIEDDHCVEALVEAKHHFDIDTYAQGRGEGVPERLRALFLDAFLDEDGRLDRHGVMRAISLGKPVFR